MRSLITIIMIAFTFISCEMEIPQGKVVFISLALDYDAPGGINALENPPEDQRVLSMQIKALSESSGEIYEEYLFLEKDGKRSINGEEYKWNHDDLINLLMDIDTVSTDLVLFHYSGHGDETGALVTDTISSSRLSPEALLTAFSGVDGRKCLFLDSCFSGSFIENNGTMKNGEIFENGNLKSDSLLSAVIPSFLATFENVAENNDSLWILAAATERQNSFDSWDTGLPQQEKFGAFSYYLALALGYDMEHDAVTVPAKGERITFYGIYSFIRKHMASDLWREATPQATLSHFDPVLFEF